MSIPPVAMTEITTGTTSEHILHSKGLVSVKRYRKPILLFQAIDSPRPLSKLKPSWTDYVKFMIEKENTVDKTWNILFSLGKMQNIHSLKYE